MSNKTYGQPCPVARAMDILGDRWTLLLIRELLLGPKRFKDLQTKLPAMGTNRLSERLSMLVNNNVIHQPAATSPAYELTELGEGLRQPVIALGIWGLHLPLDLRVHTSEARAELIALCLAGVSDPAKSQGVHAIAQFQIADEVFHIQINDGRVLARSGPTSQAVSLLIECDLETFMALALHQLTPTSALRNKRACLLQGNQRSFVQLFKILSYEVR